MTRLSPAKARAVIEAAVLVKAPTWSEDRRWHVVSGGTILVVLEPAYSGTRPAGWGWWLYEHGPTRSSPQPTRKAAAVTGLGTWERAATAKPNREDNR